MHCLLLHERGKLNFGFWVGGDRNMGSPNPYATPAHLLFDRTSSPVRWFALVLLCLTGCGPYYSLDIQVCTNGPLCSPTDVLHTDAVSVV